MDKKFFFLSLIYFNMDVPISSSEIINLEPSNSRPNKIKHIVIFMAVSIISYIENILEQLT